MAKSKNKPRSLSKAEREVLTYQRITNMSAYIEVLDKRFEAIADDVGLLIALAVANDEQKEKILNEIRKGAAEASDTSIVATGEAEAELSN